MNNKESSDYMPLMADDQHSDMGSPVLPVRLRSREAKLVRRDWLFILAILFQTVVIGILAFSKVHDFAVTDPKRRSHEPLWYSPASEVLEEEVKVFDDGFIVQTIYQELTPEADKAWKDLYYDHARIRIAHNQAAKLVNKTWPIQDDPGYYITALDVFHQIHCLDEIRQAVNKEHYNYDMSAIGQLHISHCIDSLRQYVMCHADVTTMAWQWDDRDKVVRPQLTAPHTCVNFDKIRDWAIERKLKEWISPKEFIQDDVPWPPEIHNKEDALNLPTKYRSW